MFAIPLTAYFEPQSYRQGPRTGYSFVDPATEARERLVRAVKEQRAAQQAYTDILAQRELAQLGFAHLDAYRPSHSDFAFDFSRPRGRSFYNTAHQHELAIRAKRDELIRQHRFKVALAQEEARRREELQHRQELLEAQRRQQQRRAEIQRRAAIVQQQQEQAQAIALALAFAQEIFGAQEETTETETAQPVKSCAGGCHRVRFAGPSKAPETKATTSVTPAATKFNATPAPVASTSSAPIRITIRETKGKASSHVRVNSTPSAAQPTPADAHAALAILSSDLDGLLAPTHAWASEAHRRHALNQLLEQVDAVDSGGEESVRDVRRTLVRRVERTLEGLPDEDEVPVKPKGIEIRESQPIPVSVTAKDADPIEPVAEAPAQAVATPEVEGYEIPNFLEAAPAAATTATSISADPARVEEPTDAPAPLTVWSSADPTVPVGPAVTLNDDVEVLSLHSDDSTQSSPASQFSELSDSATDSNVAADLTPKPGSGLEEDKLRLATTPDQSIKKPVSDTTSDGEDAYELL